MDTEDELPEVPEPGTSFLRQLYSCGCSGLLTMPFVAGLAEIWDHDRVTEQQSLLFTNDKTVIRYTAQSFGLIVGGVCVYSLGRKMSVILSNVLQLIAVIVIGTSGILDTKQTTQIYIGVFLIAAANQFQFVILEFYAAEMTNPTFRAFFMAFFHFNFWFAKHIGYPYKRTYDSFNAFNMVVALATVIVSCLTPETPYWLARTDRSEEAEACFRWIQAENFDEEEFISMLDKAQLVAEQRASVVAMGGSVFSKNFAFCLAVMLSMLLTIKNIWALMYTLVNEKTHRLLFEDNPVDLVDWQADYNVEETNVFFAEYLPIFGASAFLVLNFFLSRRLMFLGSVIMQLFLFPTHFMKYKEELQLLGRAGLLCYVFAYMGAIPVSTIFPLEIFPAVSRELGVVISYLMDWGLLSINEDIVYYVKLEKQEPLPIPLELQKVSRRQTQWGEHPAPETTAETNWLVNPWLPKLQNTIRLIECLLLPIGVILTAIFMPETKGLTLDEAEEIIMTVFSSEEDYAMEELPVVE